MHSTRDVSGCNGLVLEVTLKISSSTEDVPEVFPRSEKQAIGILMHGANVTYSNEALVFRNLLYSLLVERNEIVLSSFLPDLFE